MGAVVIVADANLIVYHFVRGEKTELAHKVSGMDDDWIVPLLWRHEFSNALAMSVRQSGLSLADALSTFGEAQGLLSAKEHDVNMADVLRLSAEKAISVYDAEYVVLALSKGVPLVTEDKELLRKFPGTVVSIRNFLSARSDETSAGTVREKRASYATRRKSRR